MQTDLPPRRPVGHRYVLLVLVFSVLLAGAWRWTPLRHWINVSRLEEISLWLSGYRWTPILVPAFYGVAGVLMISHALLVWATALTFPPATAVLYAEAGTFVSGTVVYWLGRILRQDMIRRLAGSHWERVSRALGRHGLSTMIIVHAFPVAPFSLISLVSGASHISYRDFVLGTLLGVTPGIVAISFFGGSLIQALHHPRAYQFVLLGVFLIAAWFILKRLQRRLFESTL